MSAMLLELRHAVRTIFARPALEKLQESLKATAPKRKAEVA